MKSQHRHELETNWLAQHAGRWLEKVQPYNSLIVGGLVGLAALSFGYSFLRSSTEARQSEAWDTFNEAVVGYMPNLETLRESAEEYPDSPMQQWADVTWADGQVWMASRAFIQNRSAAMDALDRAAGVYQGLLRETDDAELSGRAHIGLGRVYELRNELDRARAEYMLVTGSFTTQAEKRSKDLDDPMTRDAYAWLATAQAPRRAPPAGPGTPGLRPDFSPGEINMPPAGTKSSEGVDIMKVEDLFKGIGDAPTDTDPDRYDVDSAPADAKTESEAAPADNTEQPKN